MQHQHRQLAAILFTDIVGYTSMMQMDEQGAVAVVQKHHSVVEGAVPAHHGEVHSFYGDGCLCIFPTATEAVRCAIEIQKQMNTGQVIPLRIGLHIGEIFFEQEKVMGDAVNIASRIQSLGQANTILFSKEIVDKLRNQPGFQPVSLGMFAFKNVNDPMEVFALANEGLVVPKRSQLEGKLKKKNETRGKILIALLLVALVAGFIIYKQFSSRATTSSRKDKSIAILPFTNMSNDKENEYFSDGMTDETITRVSKISALKVISRTSTMLYKNSTKPLKQIAEELGVSYILVGGIQKSVDSVRINAQLVDAETDQHLWAENYDRGIKELFAIQNEVAQNIASVLETKLTPQEKKDLSTKYTANIEAYKLYRKGRWFWDKRSKENYDSAESYYHRAIQLDPDYALAYAGLADCYTYNQKGLTQLEAIPIASAYTSKALSLDSTLTEALTTKAFIQCHFNFDWKGAKIILEKVIHENPNYAIAHIYYGNTLILPGDDVEEGINEAKKAVELDPLSSSYNMILGRDYYQARQFDLAIAQIQKTLLIDPKFNPANVVLGRCLLQKKKYAEAIEAFSRLPQGKFDLGTSRSILLAYAFAMSGDKIRAKAEFEKIPTTDMERISLVLLSYYFIAMGDFAAALTQIERAYQEHDIRLISLKVDADVDPIRNEPRYKEMIRKLNLN